MVHISPIALLGDSSILIALTLPFIGFYFLSRKLGREVGGPAYLIFFPASLVSIVVHLLASLSKDLHIITFAPGIFTFLQMTTFFLACFFMAIGTAWLLRVQGLPIQKNIVIFTSIGLLLSTLASLLATLLPLLLPYATLTMMLLTLGWCYLSLSYYNMGKMMEALERGPSRARFAYAASVIYLALLGINLISLGASYPQMVPEHTYLESLHIYQALGLIGAIFAFYSSTRLAKTALGRPLGMMPVARRLTGIEMLQDLLPEGIPEPLTLLILGDAGSGKTSLSTQIAAQKLKKGGSVAYATMDLIPDGVKKMLSTLDVDVAKEEEEGKLAIIDCYTPRSGEISKEEYSADPVRLLDVSVVISQAIAGMQSEDRAVLMDSFTSILQEKGLRAIEFLRTILAKMAVNRVTFIFTLNRRAFTPAELALIQEMSHGVIELKMEEEKGKLVRYLRISKMPSVHFRAGWVHLS